MFFQVLWCESEGVIPFTRLNRGLSIPFAESFSDRAAGSLHLSLGEVLDKLWGLFWTQQLLGDMEDPGAKHTYWSELVGVSCLKTRERCDYSVKMVWRNDIQR